MLIAAEQPRRSLAGEARRGGALRLASISSPLSAAAGAARLTDDEPANDSIGTAAIDVMAAPGVSAHGGEFELDPLGNTDYLASGGLLAGDIVVISTTPLDYANFEDLGTVMGLFTSAEQMKRLGDDALNEELGPLHGLGSLCQVRSVAPESYQGAAGFFPAHPTARSSGGDGIVGGCRCVACLSRP